MLNSPIFSFFNFPNSELYLMNDFDFRFQWRGSENQQLQNKKEEKKS